MSHAKNEAGAGAVEAETRWVLNSMKIAYGSWRYRIWLGAETQEDTSLRTNGSGTWSTRWGIGRC
jgi:hypothetical protein